MHLKSSLSLRLIIMLVVLIVAVPLALHVNTQTTQVRQHKEKVAAFEKIFGVPPENPERKNWRQYVQVIITDTISARSDHSDEVLDKNMDKREELTKSGQCVSPGVDLHSWAVATQHQEAINSAKDFGYATDLAPIKPPKPYRKVWSEACDE